MKNLKIVLSLFLVVSLMFSISACASTGDASTPNDKNNQPAIPNSNESDPEAISEDTLPTEKITYDFEGNLDNWCLSTWVSDNNGELGFTNLTISSDQKASGSSSVAITCDMKGTNGSSKNTKGAFKINFDQPVDFKGRLITAKVYLPKELFSKQFKSASYGAILYIKTTDNYIWSDSGWNDIANTLKPGWNEISYAPIGVRESETREIGIMIGKGDGALDWSGTIYIDDISF